MNNPLYSKHSTIYVVSIVFSVKQGHMSNCCTFMDCIPTPSTQQMSPAFLPIIAVTIPLMMRQKHLQWGSQRGQGAWEHKLQDSLLVQSQCLHRRTWWHSRERSRVCLRDFSLSPATPKALSLENSCCPCPDILQSKSVSLQHCRTQGLGSRQPKRKPKSASAKHWIQSWLGHKVPITLLPSPVSTGLYSSSPERDVDTLPSLLWTLMPSSALPGCPLGPPVNGSLSPENK